MPMRLRPLRRPTTWLLLSCLTLGVHADRVHAEEKSPTKNEKDEARAKFQHGVDLFKDGDFRAALIAFKRAYELSPNYRVLYNIGQASAEAQDYPAAWDAFHRYLQEGGREIPVARRTQVEGELKKLDGRIAHLTITTNVDDAEILIDDLVAGRSPLSAPLVIGAGRRKLTVAAPNRESQTRLVDVAGGDDLKIEITVPPPKLSNRPLPEAQDAPLPPTEVARPEVIVKEMVPPAPPHRSSLVPIGLATTGVLLAGSVTAAIFALRAKHDLDHVLSTQTDARAAIDDARERTKRWALATDVLGGSALLTGATTALIALWSGRQESRAVEVGLNREGISLSGTF